MGMTLVLSPPTILTLPAAYIIALPISSACFGLSLATYALCVRTLCRSPFSAFSRVRWVLLGVASAMVVVGAVGLGQQIRHNLNAFVYWKDGTDAAGELNDPKDPMNYVHVVTYPIQSFLGDSILLYRTYVVYQNWRVLVLPGLLMLGESACGWGLLVGTFQLSTGAFTAPSVAKWELSYISLALALNVLCTGLIAVRILRTSRAVAGCITGSSKLLNNVARVLVETGLVYTAHTLLIMVLTARRSLVLYPAAESFIPMTAICFHLIIIRTGHASPPVDTTVTSELQFASSPRRTDMTRSIGSSILGWDERKAEADVEMVARPAALD